MSLVCRSQPVWSLSLEESSRNYLCLWGLGWVTKSSQGSPVLMEVGMEDRSRGLT